MFLNVAATIVALLLSAHFAVVWLSDADVPITSREGVFIMLLGALSALAVVGAIWLP